MRSTPWLLTFALSFGATLWVGSAPACLTQECLTAFDCAAGEFCSAGHCQAECFVDSDCTSPPDCRDNPLNCPPRGARCNSIGRCVGAAAPPAGPTRSTAPVRIPTKVDGLEDPPGTGAAFVIDHLAIADEGRGVDVDHRCRSPGDCVDNALHELGDLVNDQIRQGISSGDTLLLMELAGLERPFTGNEDTLTVKWYAGRDADPIYDSTNNFAPPPGETRCCEFTASERSLAGAPRQARARAPAKIERGRLESLLPMDLELSLTIGRPPYPSLHIDEAFVRAFVPANTSKLEQGILGGAVPISSLAHIKNPLCAAHSPLCVGRNPNAPLISLIATILQPDIDLDTPLDGLDRLEGDASGRLARCVDGFGEVVPPHDSNAPESCAERPEMADGYSVGVSFSAVRATIVGVGQ